MTKLPIETQLSLFLFPNVGLLVQLYVGEVEDARQVKHKYCLSLVFPLPLRDIDTAFRLFFH